MQQIDKFWIYSKSTEKCSILRLESGLPARMGHDGEKIVLDVPLFVKFTNIRKETVY